MARYIDADELIKSIEKVASNFEFADGESDLFPYSYGELGGLRQAIMIVEKAPTANVVSRNDNAIDIISGIKRQIQDRAVYPYKSGIDAYITLHVVDAIIRDELKKRMGEKNG